MKEASGELSMTAVAIVAIAAVGVIFTTLIWPAIQNGLRKNTYCTQAYACDTSQCTKADSTMSCKYTADDGNAKSITCPCNSK